MYKIICVIGTRPEVIKMAPVIKAIKKKPSIELRTVCTAQHREMLDEMMQFFGIKSDIDLNIMQKGQTLPELTARLPIPLDETLTKEKPDLVLVQGDTSTAFLVSLACFYQKIPVGHVEAGLRTGNLENPFPEELNRIIIGRISSLHFAPTENAKNNLIAEGCNKGIYVTGNTVIDSLDYILAADISIDPRIDLSKKLILVTSHRRENLGEPLKNICRAIIKIADQHEDVQIFYPVHPNPMVLQTVHELLSGHQRIILSDPLDYQTFVHTMKHAYIILSDSGGVQEEAPSLKVPVLVMRETTERPEAVELGAAKLVGTNCKTIIESTEKLLNDPKAYAKMQIEKSPYGDGQASKRIAIEVGKFLNSAD